MAAINQHITYNEFLPRIIGWNYMNLYNLRVATEGYTNEYDATCNPGIFNEFATAAFRFGHSLIRPMLTRMAPNWREMPRHIRLRDGFFNPDMLYETAMIDEERKYVIKLLKYVIFIISIAQSCSKNSFTNLILFLYNLGYARISFYTNGKSRPVSFRRNYKPFI